MLNKDKIIELAWLSLGDQNQYYNDTTSDRYRIASMLFENIKDEIALDTNFLFNANVVKLNKSLNQIDVDFGTRYDYPVDYLAKVYCSDLKARFLGECIYSEETDVTLTYCREMVISEYPKYLERYFRLELANRLCDAYPLQSSNKQLIMEQVKTEMNRIVKQEGLPFEIAR